MPADKKLFVTDKDLKIAKGRGPANAAARHEELRRKIQGVQILSNIAHDIQELRTTSEELGKLKATNKRQEGAIKKDLLIANAKLGITNARVQTLDKALTHQFRLLNKVLPDLKSLELSNPSGGDLFQSLAETFGKLYQK